MPGQRRRRWPNIKQTQVEDGNTGAGLLLVTNKQIHDVDLTMFQRQTLNQSLHKLQQDIYAYICVQISKNTFQ